MKGEASENDFANKVTLPDQEVSKDAGVKMEEDADESHRSEDTAKEMDHNNDTSEKEGGGEDVEAVDDEDTELPEEEEEAESPRKRTKQDRETARKDRSLAELLLMLDEYRPVTPDAVTDYYLARSGFECDDIRVKRLLALAAQKFVSDIAVDALQYCKIRGQGPQTKDRRNMTKDKRTVLTMDDLSAALADHGVNMKKPEYFL
ncbi:uncharacterized protein SPPG_03497 [Spizellomyces punctatus DAOM BR117]|uniref:Transcription initiation factor TFIID subunit 10 n=1 Tax=Spizellomyces punctatus (strain DAOM BR117) TaxID=645134 RepID=A0A0L0HKS7_SPIPD|nr:uncharacterized protein SPPG_03497 [Spizellomyces punctatus DAOM BR117]KND01702.1 hypothetical protein SPPG_03497 [Spizellomyces punctatus DAOM BR117]|eukprot:XP_016609741.1 hypothetical protein SPPG_03497 [Spizellomyces punctatus DAOM BR117]